MGGGGGVQKSNPGACSAILIFCLARICFHSCLLRSSCLDNLQTTFTKQMLLTSAHFATRTEGNVHVYYNEAQKQTFASTRMMLNSIRVVCRCHADACVHAPFTVHSACFSSYTLTKHVCITSHVYLFHMYHFKNVPVCPGVLWHVTLGF